jgi:hypothetical protein
MRHRSLAVTALTICSVLAADDLVKPDKLSLHTWVREDIFAGWMVRDEAALERGAQKVARHLRDHPNDRSALSWQFLVESLRFRNQKDDAVYQKQLAAANALRERIFPSDSKDVGPYIIIGGTLINLAVHAREKDREWMYREGREILSKVPALQGPTFEKLPPHMRGELWSSLALASDGLKDRAERDRILDTMLEQLKGTAYESRARRWKGLEAITNPADHLCISCHEPGRLKPTMARLGIQ